MGRHGPRLSQARLSDSLEDLIRPDMGHVIRDGSHLSPSSSRGARGRRGDRAAAASRVTGSSAATADPTSEDGGGGFNEDLRSPALRGRDLEDRQSALVGGLVGPAWWVGAILNFG